MKKKILIFKNDRGGDLISSIRLIHNLMKNNDIDIYLSELNYNFRFLLKGCKLKKINYNLTLSDKFKILINIFRNKYKEIFILTPKNFYYYLPVIFRNIKFNAIIVNGKKRNRPPIFLRKFLNKTSIRHRTKTNELNIIESNLSLVDLNINDDQNLESLKLINSNENSIPNLPKNYIFFHFKKRFFDELNWGTKEFDDIIKVLKTKYNNIVFSSDIEKNKYDNYFFSNFTSIDFEQNYKFTEKNEKNIIYLKKIDPKNLFLVIKGSQMVLGPHGLITQISYLLDKKNINLFNFKIRNLEDYHHQKISFSEWYSNMNLKFILLNSDINKAIKKISKFI